MIKFKNKIYVLSEESFMERSKLKRYIDWDLEKYSYSNRENIKCNCSPKSLQHKLGGTCRDEQYQKLSIEDKNLFDIVLTRWATAFAGPLLVAFEQDPCSKIESNTISFNKALFLLLDLNYSHIESKRGPIFAQLPNYFSMEKHIKCRDTFRYLSEKFEEGAEEIDSDEFFTWAIDIGLLKALQRTMPEEIARHLFDQLKEHGFISIDSFFGAQWKWKTSKKNLAWLASELSMQEIITSQKFMDLGAYIPEATEKNMAAALRDANSHPNRKTEKITAIVDLIVKENDIKKEILSLLT